MADIVLDRSAPARLRRLRLSTSTAIGGAAFTAEVLDRTAGTELRLTGNPGNRYTLTGTTLTGTGLSRGVDTPAITELPGATGALGPRETEFAIVVSHDPTVPAFTRPGAGGAAPTIAFSSPTASIAEGNSGTTAVTNTINVTRNGVTGALVVNLTYGGTAMAGNDYATGPASVTIPSGANAVSFDLAINGDATVEPDETIVITATLAAYPTATASKTITILNDDVAAITRNIASGMRYPGFEVGAASLSNGTDTTHNSRVWRVNDSGFDRTNIAPEWVGSYTSTGATAEVDINGSLTVSAALEYPIGTITPFTFNGAPTGTVTPGGFLVADPLPITVPSNALHGIRTSATCAAGVKWPGVARIASGTGAQRQDEAENGTGLADKSASGTIGTTANYCYAPVAIRSTAAPSTFRPVCFGIVGTSIMAGAASGSYDANGNKAGVGRGCTGKAPVMHMAVTGTKHADTMGSGQFDRRIAAMARNGVTHVLIDYGTNDIQAGATLASLQSLVLAACQKITDAGMKPIWSTTLPRQNTAGQDAGETVAGQVVDTTGGFTAGTGSVRAQFNAWIRTKPGTMYDFVELADLFDVNSSGVKTRAGGYWLAGPDTYLEGPTNVTIGASATTTSVPTSSTKPAGYWANFSQGYIRFTSGALAGTVASISNNTAGGVLTMTAALASAPVSGDTAVLQSARMSSAVDRTHPTIADNVNIFGGDFYIRDAMAAKLTALAA